MPCACPNDTMIWIAMASSAHHAPDRRFVRTQRISVEHSSQGHYFAPGSIHCRAAGSHMSIAHNADRAITLPSGYRQTDPPAVVGGRKINVLSWSFLLPPPWWGRVGVGGRSLGHRSANWLDPPPPPPPPPKP